MKAGFLFRFRSSILVSLFQIKIQLITQQL